MVFTMTIDMDNAAFQDEGHATELVRILQHVAAQVADGVEDGTLRDLNGNRVGSFAVADGHSPE